METKIASRLSPRQQKAFQIAKKAAVQVVQRRLRLLRLVRSGFHKLTENENALKRVKGDLSILLRLSKAWARREYRAVPWQSVLYTVAALIYFISPLDLIPDALTMIGFVDDIAVISAVVSAIRDDIDRFRSWEELQ